VSKGQINCIGRPSWSKAF